jgi:hypothetical protein
MWQILTRDLTYPIQKDKSDVCGFFKITLN